MNEEKLPLNVNCVRLLNTHVCSSFPSFSLVYLLHLKLCARGFVELDFPLLFCSIRSLTEFPKILAIAVDSLLCSCDDQESDVRLVAGESLNKLVKVRYIYFQEIIVQCS